MTPEVSRDIGGLVFKRWETGTVTVDGVVLVPDRVAELIAFLTGAEEPLAHHSAQPGEVWDLDSTQGVTYRVVAVYDDDVSDEVPIFIQPSTGTWFSLDDPLFTGGERVL